MDEARSRHRTSWHAELHPCKHGTADDATARFPTLRPPPRPLPAYPPRRDDPRPSPRRARRRRPPLPRRPDGDRHPPPDGRRRGRCRRGDPRTREDGAVTVVGVLTAGGDCPGLNAVIRAVTARIEGVHGSEVVGILDGWEGLMTGRVRPLRRDDVRGILGRGGTVLGTSRMDP
ncbi:MAG TPA: hypothetical protein ENK55_07565, partial [Actinobacteria bacterium]|nr:hypothetical protein [Actinomycetota bacterium]